MYKKLLTLSLCLLLLVTGLAVPAQAAENLLANGDFENLTRTGVEVYGWTTNGNVSSLTEKVSNGDRAISIAGKGYVFQKVENLVGGTEYTLSADIRIVGKGVPFFYVIWKNENGKINDEVIDFETSSYSTEWSRHEHTFTAPESATVVDVYLRSRKNSGDVVFDNAVLTGQITAEKGADAPEAVVYDASVATGKTGELAANPDFEILDESGLPASWKADQAPYKVSKSGGHSGKNAVILDSTGASDFDYISGVKQRMNFVAGAKYKFSLFTKDATEGMVLRFLVEFSDGDAMNFYYDDLGTTEWKEITLEFTAPQSGGYMAYIRTHKTEGKVTVDDFSITGEIYNPSEEFLPPYDETCTELLENTSFEIPNAAGNGAAGWVPYNNGSESADWSKAADFVTWTNEKARTGSYSVRIDNTEGKNAWVRFYIPEGILPGAYYQLSFWAYCDSLMSDGVGYKFEWQTDTLFGGEQPGGNTHAKGLGNTDGEWRQYVVSGIAPDVAVGVLNYVRLYSKGIAYIDDVSFYRVSESKAKPATVNTSDIFFDTDYEGDVEITITKSPLVIAGNKVPMDGATVKFSFRDGDTVLAESEAFPFTEESMSYAFPFTLIAEKEKEYRIVATLTDGAGKVYTLPQRVYKFDRPTAINEAGLYIDNNGEVFDPVIAYHVGELRDVPNRVNYLDDGIAMGANVMQTTAVKNVNKVIEQLDTLWEKGLRALVCLYPDMMSAGNAKMVKTTEEIVAATKDHPAVFAWAVMDEPFQQIYATEDPTQNRDNELIDAYLAIKKNDTHHPVYLCECQSLDSISRYCDVFLIDAYKKSYGQNTKLINEKYNFAKPVYTLLPAAVSGRDTIDTFRFQMYDSYFEGSLSISIYGLEFPYLRDLGTLKEDLIALNQSGERDEAAAHFIHNKYQLLSEKVASDEAYSVYVKDGKVHAVIVNRLDEAKEITVPLVSADGKTAIGDATVTGLYGSSDSYRASGGAVTVKLEGKRAAVYEITPDTATDFSALRLRSRFRDLNTITWAKDSIEKLDSLGIVNDGGNPRIYAPQTNITRGEFAMFLVRTLGLDGAGAENFSDVDPDAEYAKEIAAGRAAGILNGVGDNLYNPEAEITRQDMMTIIARGMKLTGETDMSAFSDSALVADYALPHVNAMIASGLIKGNADGTLNPQGNTTRAESAVIMDRILQMQ